MPRPQRASPTRVQAFEQRYDWIDNNGLTYLRNRAVQGPSEANQALDIVLHFCRSREQQERASTALAFKCDVLWSILDAIEHAAREK